MSFFFRMKLGQLIDTTKQGVLELPRTDPYGSDDRYVNFYIIGLWSSWVAYIYAVNAMLTWLKLFKWLNHFPSMQILTRMLGMTSKASAMAVYVQATFLQGLIQCTAACLKIPMEQPRGLARLSDLGTRKLASVSSDLKH